MRDDGNQVGGEFDVPYSTPSQWFRNDISGAKRPHDIVCAARVASRRFATHTRWRPGHPPWGLSTLSIEQEYVSALTLNRFLDWFLLAALACLAGLAIWRLVTLFRLGVRVVVVDRQRSAVEMLCDLLLLVSMLLWGWLIIASAWPLSVGLVPDRLNPQLIDAVALKFVGAGLVAAGVVLYGLALAALGDSWRLGIDRQTPGRLMTGGVLAWTRNPIYLAFDLLAVGTFLLQGRLIFLLLAILIVLTLHEQIRREERYLAGQYGDEYRDYCARTGRYVTWRAFQPSVDRRRKP